MNREHSNPKQMELGETRLRKDKAMTCFSASITRIWNCALSNSRIVNTLPIHASLYLCFLMRRADTKLCKSVSVYLEPSHRFCRVATPKRIQEDALPRGARRLSSPQCPVTSCSQVGRKSISSPWRDNNLPVANINQRQFSTMAESKSWWKGSSKPAESEPPQSFESKPMDMPEETEADTEQLPTRRVHILGLGSIGTLIAHSLQCLPNPPPITLLMHRPEMEEQFKINDRIIRLLNPNNDVNDEQSGYDLDVLNKDESGQSVWHHVSHRTSQGPINPLQPWEEMDSGEVLIYTLIVTVKGPATVQALQSIKHRVNAQTTICLVQNGMGQVDLLNKAVFTDPETRPTYILGIISHGAHMRGPFTVMHAGFGTTALGIYRDTDKFPLPPKSKTFDVNQLDERERRKMYPTDEELYSNLSSRYLLRTLTRSPVLACAPYPYLDLFQLQLEKLVMNSILNPFTALLNIPNGSMLESQSIARAQRLLLAEISLVIRGLPELEGVPGVNKRFSADRLETLCQGIAEKTAKNSSSMREDVRNLKRTEIDFINGYIVRRGEEQGIKCVLNYLIMKLIHAKSETSIESDIQPYGTNEVEGDRSPIGADPDSAVMLEDRGTLLKGKAY